jgi:hypothetical protein
MPTRLEADTMTDDTETRPKRDPIQYRHPTTVTAILGYTAEANDDNRKPTWDEIVDHATTAGIEWRTAENIIYDLCAFGALYRHGAVRGRGENRQDTRAVSITTLGRHWLAGTNPPPLHPPEETP